MADSDCKDIDMGENAIDPNENKEAENEVDAGTDEITDVSEAAMTAEEYHALDNKLDELNSALDFIEEKNDSIYNQLQSLLQSNKEVRQQLAEENMSGDTTPNS